MNEFLHKLPEFIGNHVALSALFAVLLVALIATHISTLFSKIKELSPAGLTVLINRETPLLIDISPRDNFEKAHIPGSRHVAMSQFDPENKKLTAAKALPVVLVCKTGQTAGDAAKRLKKAGFEQVYVLDGGIGGWQQAELPLAKGRG